MKTSGLSTSKGRALFVCTIIFQLLAIGAVGLRILAKRLRRRPFELHDYLIFAALAFSTGYAVENCLAAHPFLIGLHIQDALKLSPNLLVDTLKGNFASVFLWVSATALIKLSILHLYVGVFAKPGFRMGVYVLATVIVAFWFSYVLAEFLICRPLAYNWDKTVKGTCGNLTTQIIAVAVINAVLDFASAVLPMPVLWNLQMAFKKKIMLTGIFSLAGCICTINIVRIGLVASASSTDFTYTGVDSGLLSGLEIYLGVIIACLPTFWSLIKGRHTSSGGYSGKRKYIGTPSNSNRTFGSSPPASKGPKGLSSAAGFEALSDDDVPLRNMPGFGGSTEVSASAWPEDATTPGGGSLSAVHFNGGAGGGSRRGLREDAINVKTDVQVFDSTARGTTAKPGMTTAGGRGMEVV